MTSSFNAAVTQIVDTLKDPETTAFDAAVNDVFMLDLRKYHPKPATVCAWHNIWEQKFHCSKVYTIANFASRLIPNAEDVLEFTASDFDVIRMFSIHKERNGMPVEQRPEEVFAGTKDRTLFMLLDLLIDTRFIIFRNHVEISSTAKALVQIVAEDASKLMEHQHWIKFIFNLPHESLRTMMEEQISEQKRRL